MKRSVTQRPGFVGFRVAAPNLQNLDLIKSSFLIYQQLEENLQFFSRIPVVGYDVAAAVEFQKLRKLHRRDGAMDLKIAAIALTQDAMVLTQNLADFTHIQHLKVADWLRE